MGFGFLIQEFFLDGGIPEPTLPYSVGDGLHCKSKTISRRM